MSKRIFRRVILWLCFGFILTLVPLAIVALITAPANSGLVSFLNAASNEDLLAVAFTLAAAAAADVLIPQEDQTVGIWRVLAGSITIVFAIFTAMMYVVLKTHSYHVASEQIVLGTQIVYGISMVCSLVCEILSEV